MAERRMFSKTIIDSDMFLDMPLSTQALYFHLSMRADDEGFINNPKKIQRMIGASDDDMKVLITKQFIIPFDSGIVVIKHWRIHNYIRNDRFKPTICNEEKSHITERNGIYDLSKMPSIKQTGCHLVYQTDTTGIPSDNQVVYQMDTQDRIGKDRLDKDNIGKDKRESIDYQRIVDMYNDTCVSFPRLKILSDSRKKSIKARFNAGYTYDDFKNLFVKAEKSAFLKGANNRNWSATFDWLIKDSNIAKVLDGNYDEKSNYTNSSDTKDYHYIPPDLL